MSACSNFTPRVWKKNQCRKCSRTKDEHSTDSISATPLKCTASDMVHLVGSQELSRPVSFVKDTAQKQISADNTERPSMSRLNEQKTMGTSHHKKGTYTRVMIGYFIKEYVLSNLRRFVLHRVYEHYYFGVHYNVRYLTDRIRASRFRKHRLYVIQSI
jgi:hypothetical protein